MAFLDFMNRGVGGMTSPQTTPGLYGESDITTTPSKPIGPTYNDIAKAAMTYGSQPNSSTPMIAKSIPGSGWAQNQVNPLLASNASSTAKKVSGQSTDDKDASLDSIYKFLLNMFIGA